MDIWIERASTVLVTLIASSGFWACFQHFFDKNNAERKMLLGLGYEKVMSMAAFYIQRGWIAQDEYKDFRKYLYEPYRALGGDGSAERNMKEVDKLPLRPNGWTEKDEAEFQAKQGG